MRKERTGEPSYLRGQEIKVIEKPTGEIIHGLARARFTGLSYHPGREQPWDVWKRGEIIKFGGTKEEALASLKEASVIK